MGSFCEQTRSCDNFDIASWPEVSVGLEVTGTGHAAFAPQTDSKMAIAPAGKILIERLTRQSIKR
jgi:hypothetical protein